MKPTYVFAVVGSMLSLAVVAWSVGDARRGHDIADIQRQIAALASQEAIRSAPAPAQPPQQSPPIAAAMVAAPVAPTSLSHPTAAPESSQPARPSEADIRDRFEIDFVSDCGAAPWNGVSQQEAVAKISAALPAGSSLRSFDCHQTLCRLETSHPDLQHHTAFVRAAFVAEDTKVWNAAFYSTREDEGGGALLFVTYFTQDGQELPSM